MRRGSSKVEQVWKGLKWNKCIFHNRKRKEEALNITEIRLAGRLKKEVAIQVTFSLLGVWRLD